MRVLLALFTVVFAIGLVQKYPCGATEWSDSDVRYAKMCYSDIPYLYTGRGFAEHRWPYDADDARYQVMEYPVGISYLAWGVAELVRPLATGPDQAVRAAVDPGELWGLPGMTDEVNLYFLLSALVLFLCGLGAVWFLAGASPGRPWDAAGFALSPLLLLAGLVNWDLLAVLFTAAALWAWARGRPVLTGVLIGLGVATKLYPLFLLGGLLVEAMRRRKAAAFLVPAAAAAATWLVANLPAMLSGFTEWQVFWSFNSDRGADLGSLWLLLDQQGVIGSDAAGINAVSLGLFGLACIGILVLGIRAPRQPRLAQTAFLIVAAFLLVNKVYSPQYVLWLLPLAALAHPRWRDLLVWQAGELLYFAAVWIYLGGWLAPSSGDVPWAYHLAILARVGGQVFLVTRVVRAMHSGDDPAAVAQPAEVVPERVELRRSRPGRTTSP